MLIPIKRPYTILRQHNIITACGGVPQGGFDADVRLNPNYYKRLYFAIS